MNILPGTGVIVDHSGVRPLPGEAVVTRGEVVELRAQVAALTALNEVLLAMLLRLPGGAEAAADIIVAVTEGA